MILLGCLLALTVAVMPRVVLVGAWIFADRWVVVWDGEVLMPLLGIVFLPYTTIMYILTWHPDGIVGYAWVWLLMGVVLDLVKWGHVLTNRERGTEYVQRYYPSSGTDSKGGAAES